MRKLPLYVSACIMPFCLNSHGDCILYKSALHHQIFGSFNLPVFLKLFLGKFNLYARSKDQNKNKNKKLNFWCHRKYSLPLKSTPQYFDQKKLCSYIRKCRGRKKSFPWRPQKKFVYKFN